jgi:hypothetical protein
VPQITVITKESIARLNTKAVSLMNAPPANS